MPSTWKKYAGKILRRCDLCGKFQATYRVEDPTLGSLKICLNCWKHRQKNHPPEEEKKDSF